MVVAYNASWKIPVAYYLIHGLSSEQKANIVQICLSELHTTGIIIKSLTFDGAANNIAMASTLGANLHYPHLKTYFDHPDTKEPVHIILDPCHMLKLCRNTLGDLGKILNGSILKLLLNYKIILDYI